MLSYYGPDKLEKLLEDLFADDELTEEIVVLGGGPPIPFGPSPECCHYSYTSYG